MSDVGDCGAGPPDGSGVAGNRQSEHPGGGHSGGVQPGGVPASGAGRADPGERRDPYRDVLDPQGPMGMPKIVSRAANRLGHGPRGGGDLVAAIYALSVLAIIIALGIFFIVGGPHLWRVSWFPRLKAGPDAAY